MIEEPMQLRIGNFALPNSQQPSSLYGFGQYILDTGDLLGACASSFEIGQANNNSSTVIPYILYGIRNDMVVLVSLPFSPQLNEGCNTSSGLLDAEIEIEYLLYAYRTERASWEVSIEGSLTLPFGSASKTPPTGFGSPAFFAGVIARYIAVDWYGFVSAGGIFTTAHNKNRAGTEFPFQAGIGRNVGYESEKWICTLMVEMNGLYTQQDIACGVQNPNTGGTMIALGPTLWFSTQRFIFQMGILPVIYQHYKGKQAKNNLLVDLNFEWKF